MSSPFIHLHTHSEYSLLEAGIRLPDLMEKCKTLGMSAVALTDNGTLYGTIDFYLTAKSKGIKPIVGCEMYVTPNIAVKERGWDRLILLCQDYKGYQNLVKLVTIAHLDGFYYKPRIDLAHLAQFSEGLIAISPCLRGPVGYALRSNQKEEATQKALAYKDIYKHHFYLGLHRTDQAMEDIVIESSLELSRELEIPVVATNDVYYLEKDQAYVRDILSCIQTGKILEDDTRMKLQTQELSFKTSEDMAELFKDIPEALENTVKIADRCNLHIETEQVNLPRFECPNNKTSEAYLEELVWQGIAEKYPIVSEELKARVEFELKIICQMQYAPYFLIIHDFLSHAFKQGIPCGPGRGSAAGSIVAYALNITRIDPIRYNLLFERFLNPERVSMPDIDLDFCIRRRGEIIEYLNQKYGADHVSQIITFGTMAARGVIRDVGRVLNVPLSAVDRIAKLIPSSPGSYTSIPEALDQVPELKKLYNEQDEYKQLLDIGAQLEGLSRHTSTHAAGVVISRDPLSSVVPLIRNDGQTITQFSMTDLEKVGLLKMDILGLRNLTVMQDACQLIKKYQGVNINLDALPIDDPKTYELLSSGETAGVFQLEGRGIKQLTKEMKPSVFEDIIALLALYRPGPLGSGMVNEFVSNKLGKTQVRYDLPQLEPILKETYGLIVYQEQVMQIASVIGGFTLGQADMLRRAMGKKKKEEMDKLRDEFIEGAKKKEINADKARYIFELCYKFAEYGFNKSHSAAYALISFQTAYLKANYPVEYMAALLSSILGVADRVSIYIQECKRLGIPVLPPDVNASDISFSIQNIPQENGQSVRAIRFGLGAIKNVGDAAIRLILEQRNIKPFTSFADFCVRVDLKTVNKRVIESLIKCGGFDSLADRAQLLACFESIIEQAQFFARERENGQIGLFSSGNSSESLHVEMPDTYAYLPYDQKLKMEKELLGLYVSGHPLDAFKDILDKSAYSTDTLKPEDEGKSVTLIGYLSECRRIITKQKREMITAKLEDLNGSVTILLFQTDKFETLMPHFVDDAIVKLSGRLRQNQDEFSIICDQIDTLSQQMNQKILYIDTEHIDDMDLYKAIKNVLIQFKGETPVYFKVGETIIASHQKFSISQDPLGLSQLENIVGPGHCWIA